MAKKKRKDYEQDPELAPPGRRTRTTQAHVGPPDLAHLTVWAQRSVLGLKSGQVTPKEALHG